MKVLQVPPGKLEKSLQNFQADILQPGIHPKFCFWGFNMFDLSRGAYLYWHWYMYPWTPKPMKNEGFNPYPEP